MKATMRAIGVEVYYLPHGVMLHADRFLKSDGLGWVEVSEDDVEFERVTEWLETTDESDLELCEQVYRRFQNGIEEFTNEVALSESLGVRSMMMGDRVVLQTENRGTPRVYQVASFGFDRV